MKKDKYLSSKKDIIDKSTTLQTTSSEQQSELFDKENQELMTLMKIDQDSPRLSEEMAVGGSKKLPSDSIMHKMIQKMEEIKQQISGSRQLSQESA